MVRSVTLKAAVDAGAALQPEVGLGFLERHRVILAVVAAGSGPARVTVGVALASAGIRRGLSPAAAEAVAVASGIVAENKFPAINRE